MKIKRVLLCYRDEAASRESEMHQQKGEGRASQLRTAAGRWDHSALGIQLSHSTKPPPAVVCTVPSTTGPLPSHSPRVSRPK